MIVCEVSNDDHLCTLALLGCSCKGRKLVPFDRDGTSIAVPSGEFAFVGQKCGQPVTVVDAFVIDRQAVSCDSYRDCADAGGCEDLPLEQCVRGYVLTDHEHASDYCMWRSGRLPTNAEWQKAARRDKSTVPEGRCNLGTEPVTKRCLNRSGYGLEYTLPGFEEWTSTTCYDAVRRVDRFVTLELKVDLASAGLSTNHLNQFRCAASAGAVGSATR